MNKIPYKMKKVEINHSNKDVFVFDEKQRRQIRTGAVAKLVQLLKAGEHFDSVFVVNEREDGTKMLLDGNHRFEAISEMLNFDPTFSIEVWVAVYRDLTIDQEREVFGLWNSGTKQSADDFLKIYWDTIPMGKQILKDIPCSVYGGKQYMKAKNIVGNHLCAIRHKTFKGGYTGSAVKVVSDFRTITKEDVKTMATYVKEISDIFGEFSQTNMFWKTTPQTVFYRIWHDNLNIPPDKFKKAFKKVFLGSSQFQFETMAKSGGNGACNLFYDLSVKHLNDVKGMGEYTFKTAR